MHNIIVEYNEAIELLAALARYSQDDDFNKALKGAGFQPDADIASWVKDTKQGMSPYLDRELKLLFGQTKANFIFLQKVIAENGVTNCPAFFSSLAGTDGEAYLASLREALCLEAGLSWDGIRDALEKSVGLKLAQKLAELVNNPSETLERIQSAVVKFYDKFFCPIAKGVERILCEKSDVYARMDQEQLASLVATLMNTNIGAWDSALEIRITVSHFYEASASVFRNAGNGSIQLVFGYQIAELFSPQAMEKRRKQLFKVLSDDKRLEILKLICKRSWYGIELAKQLEITTATLSYHISKLYELGIVSFRDGEQNRIYYTADTDKLRDLFGKVLDDIIN